MDKLALKVAGAVFLLISAMHILRVAMQVPATFNQVDVPLGISVVAAVVTLALALWMFKIANK